MRYFNKETVYNNEISPLVKQIIAICKEHEIPMLAVFTYENCPQKGVGRCTTLLNELAPDLQDIGLQMAAYGARNS